MVFSVVFGFFIGGVILAVIGISPFEAYERLLTGIAGTPRNRMFSMRAATPIIFTGLSVTFAFKTGLFNIGAEGQYIIGSLVALVLGVTLQLPPGIHGLVCIIGGGLAGALWGGLAGLLKAYRGIHEVIITIMLNWIAFYISNLVVMSGRFHRPASEASISISESAQIFTTRFEERYGNVHFHWGMLLAVVMVFVVWIILNKTTLGFRLRAVGFNRNASEYSGINVPLCIFASMGISGLLAGLGGATQVLGVLGNLTQLANQEGLGFDGIAVAMIGGINPIGALFAGLFLGGMRFGSGRLNLIRVPTELVSVIIGTIIYSVAIMGAFRALVNFIKAKKEGRAV